MFDKLFGGKGKKYPKRITCGAGVLFAVLEEHTAQGLPVDILFICRDRKHSFGVYSDFADLTRNPVWYLDREEYKTWEDLEAQASLEGVPLKDLPDLIEIYEVGGAYPDTSRVLRNLMEQEN